MDTIWNAAFGVDIDIQNNKQENFYFTQCEQLFADLSNFGFVHYFSSKTPYVASNLQYSRKHEINSFFLKKSLHSWNKRLRHTHFDFNGESKQSNGKSIYLDGK